MKSQVCVERATVIEACTSFLLDMFIFFSISHKKCNSKKEKPLMVHTQRIQYGAMKKTKIGVADLTMVNKFICLYVYYAYDTSERGKDKSTWIKSLTECLIKV